MKKKKVYLLILSVCGIALSVIGVTYAFWQFRAFQTDEKMTTKQFLYKKLFLYLMKKDKN